MKHFISRMSVAFATTAFLMSMAMPAFAVPPSNDDQASATVVTALPYSQTIDTSEASSQSTDPRPSCGNESTSRSVWYAFETASDLRLEANTLGSNYDTILSIWRAASGSFTQVACNDDIGSLQSRAFFDTSAGQTYYAMVSSYGGSGGTLDFELKEAPDQLDLDISVEELNWVNAITGSVVVSGELACSRPAGVQLSFEVVQQRDGRTYQGYDSRTVQCDGTEQWMDTISGNFKSGDAGIDINAYELNSPEPAQESRSSTLRLRSCTIIGTLGDDRIQGTSRNDKICSMGGDDVINGRDGDDTLRGHDGDDTIYGGAGRDVLTGGFGRDTLSGGPGNDQLWGDAEADSLSGGGGKDVCYGGGGANRFSSCERRPS